MTLMTRRKYFIQIAITNFLIVKVFRIIYTNLILCKGKKFDEEYCSRKINVILHFAEEA